MNSDEVMWAHIVSDIMEAGNGNTPVYQQIEMLHANMTAEHLASGKPLKDCKNPWKK
jgi:hypothetical protein